MQTINAIHHPDADGFVLVHQENYEYNHSGQIIRTTRLNGKSSSADWICKGPLSVTDEDGIITGYQYDSAKRLKKVARAHTPHIPRFRQGPPACHRGDGI